MISKNTPAYSVVTVYAGVFLILHTGCNSIYIFHNKIRKRFLNSNNNINFPYCIGAKVALPDHIKLIKYIKCIKYVKRMQQL